MNSLSKIEKQIMHALWSEGKATLEQLINLLPEKDAQEVCCIIGKLSKLDLIKVDMVDGKEEYHPYVEKNIYLRERLNCKLRCCLPNLYPAMTDCFTDSSVASSNASDCLQRISQQAQENIE